MQSPPKRKSRTKTCVIAFGVAAAVAIGISAVGLTQNSNSLLALLPGEIVQKGESKDAIESQIRHRSDEAPHAVSALGRLEPASEVILLGAPSIAKSDRIGTIQIKAGQQVSKGDVIAIMDCQPRLSAELEEARSRVKVCQAQLDRVLAGAKPADISAREASVCKMKAELDGRLVEMNSIGERLGAELKFAQSEYSRYLSLYKQGAISASELDAKSTRLSTASATLAEATAERRRFEDTTCESISEAQATLRSTSEVRPVDVSVARAELLSAMAVAHRMTIDLELSTVRSPISGRILKVRAHEGEPVGQEGIAELGTTERMVAVAEVYENDIKFVKPGQLVQVSGPAFDGVLQGRVFEIGAKVTKQNVFASEPGANFDSRVVEVKVLLSPKSSVRVQGLTNLQVEVRIGA